MRTIPFLKMAAAGNDFILVDDRAGVLRGKAQVCAVRLCDRKRSVGGDGLILLQRSGRADLRMRIFNPDGSQAEMCGNGVRCLAKFAADRKIAGKKMSIETGAGLVTAEVKGRAVKARLTDPRGLKLNLAVKVNGSDRLLHFIDTGVPHAVAVARSLEHIDVNTLGKAIRRHPAFAPRGTNVDWIAFSGPRGGSAEIKIRTYERGVEQETLACGTGSAAGALVAAALHGLRSPIRVLTHGGEALKVYFSRRGGSFYDVFLEGPVMINFEGRVQL